MSDGTRRDQRVEVPTLERCERRKWSIAELPTARPSLGPIIAGVVLGAAAVFLGLPSTLLLAFSVILGVVGVALIIARPHEQPDPSVEASVVFERGDAGRWGELRSDLTEP